MGVRILVVTQAQMSELFRRTDGQWTNMPPDVLVQDVRRDWNTGNFEVKVWSMEFPDVEDGREYLRVVLEVTKAEPKQELEKKVDELLEQVRKLRPWWEIPPPVTTTTGYPGGVSIGTSGLLGQTGGPGWDPALTKK